MKYKRLWILSAALIVLTAGCGQQRAEEAIEPAVEISEAFITPAPTPEPEPTPAPVILTEYALGGGVTLVLPEDLAANVAEDGSFFLSGSSFLVSGAWFDRDYFVTYLGAEYPETAAEAAGLLITAESTEYAAEDRGDRCVVEYADRSDSGDWANYAVVTRGDNVCWRVEFICPGSLYDSMRDSFAEWADQMTLPDGMEAPEVKAMISQSGLFALEIPYAYLVIDDDTTAEELAPYGLADPEGFLEELRSRSDGQDVVYRPDFGAMFTVTVDPEADMTQAEMQDMEDILFGEETAYTYEGIILEGENRFYFTSLENEGARELGFTTYHDDTGASLTFSFVNFTEEEARTILNTLVMQTRSD